ncbi:hypothetical protein ABIA36_000121 [Leifsonia sp. EB34]
MRRPGRCQAKDPSKDRARRSHPGRARTPARLRPGTRGWAAVPGDGAPLRSPRRRRSALARYRCRQRRRGSNLGVLRAGMLAVDHPGLAGSEHKPVIELSPRDHIPGIQCRSSRVGISSDQLEPRHPFVRAEQARETRPSIRWRLQGAPPSPRTLSRPQRFSIKDISTLAVARARKALIAAAGPRPGADDDDFERLRNPCHSSALRPHAAPSFEPPCLNAPTRSRLGSRKDRHQQTGRPGSGTGLQCRTTR